jgi:hypothetical protein
MKENFMHRLLSLMIVSGLVLASITPTFARPGGGRPGPGGRGPTAGSRSSAGGLGAANVRGGNLSTLGRGGQSINGLNGGFQGGLQSTRQNAVGGAHERLGISSEQLSNLQGRAQQLRASYAPENEPFSPAWYADHPQAWQYTHPHADAWAAATAAGVAAWFGWSTAPYGYTTGTTSTVVEGEAGDGSDATRFESGSTPIGAGTAAVDPPAGLEWLPLGVYALAPIGQDEATTIVQVSVSKEGTVRGNYYDFITDQSLPVNGKIDRANQRATWNVGKGTALFETTVGELLKETTPVAVKFAEGRTQKWQLVRLKSKQGAGT